MSPYQQYAFGVILGAILANGTGPRSTKIFGTAIWILSCVLMVLDK